MDVFKDFVSFMRSAVIPKKQANPQHIRLDGELTGGKWEVFGHFRHHGRIWVVHEDTHYEPLMLAYSVAEKDKDPFVEEDTKAGRCLSLTHDLKAQRRSRFKYMYIYASRR